MSSGASLTPIRMSYAAALVGSVTYGIYVVLAGICIHFLVRRRRSTWKEQTWKQHITLAYTVVMLIVSTIYFISASKWSEVEFVEGTTNPAVFASLVSSPLAVTKDTAFTVNMWLADSLILYRLFVIWEENYFIVVLPVLIYLASIATGIGLLVETAKPGGQFGQAGVTNFGILFWSLTVGLNVITTLLIAGKLWNHQRKVRQFGRDTNEYTSIAAIFAESAALYSICGLVYIPLFAKNLPLAYPITAVWGSVTSIAPNLIILRIALGIDVTNQSTYLSTKATVPSFTTPKSGQSSTLAMGRTTQSSQTANPSSIWPDAKLESSHEPDVFPMKSLNPELEYSDNV